MVLIIAEAGVNHNGSLSIAKELVDAAKLSGADIVKFQIFNSLDLVNITTKKANYQTLNTDSNETQFEMLRKLELTFEQHEELKMYCDDKNIEYLASGFDLKSLEFIKDLILKEYSNKDIVDIIRLFSQDTKKEIYKNVLTIRQNA